MITSTSEQQSESYRERLYLHYLATHRGTAVAEAQTFANLALPYFKRIQNLIPADKSTRVLDLGCGCGGHLYCLKRFGYTHLEGIDRSPEQVAGAHSLGLNFVKEGDIFDHLVQRQSESADVVLAFDVIEHLKKEEAFQFADEVFRVLAPGGVFILHLPNGEGFLFGSVAFNDLSHELILTKGSLGQLLRCAGFSQVEAFEDSPIVHGPVSAARYLIWKAVSWGLRFIYVVQTGDTGRHLILSQNFLAIARKP